jgi:ferrous iron transport protein A
MTLSELKQGAIGIVKEFTDLEMSVKLMEMGCLPGEEITIARIAPLGDPIAVNVSGYQLSLRKFEASKLFCTSFLASESRYKSCAHRESKHR